MKEPSGGHCFETEPETIDFLIAHICRLHYHRVHLALEKLGLYRGQPRLLRLLWEREGCTHSELAKEMRIQPATVTKMLQRMEKAGFLLRRHDSEDERVSRVYLTDRGKAVKDQVKQIMQNMEKVLLKGFTRDEREALHNLLLRIRDNL